MASDPEFVAFVVDQFEADCAVTSKRMFGEYGLFSGDVFFGAVCDDRLFVKPTEGGRAFIGDVVEAPMYAGAKSSLLIGDRLEDPEWLSELVRVTVRELAQPKKRAKKRARQEQKAENCDKGAGSGSGKGRTTADLK